MLFTIIIFVLVLSILVFVHELGHFWVARKFGLKPEEFGFGFPPRAWGIYKDINGAWKTTKGKKKVTDASDTIYSINWLPLGGFVKLGEDDTDVGDDPNHFTNKPIYARAAILLAGVTMNIILAAFLITIGFMVGLPQTTEDLSPSAIVSEKQIQIIEVEANSPAAAAELKMGDIIAAINGNALDSTEALQSIHEASVGEALNYNIKRGDEELSVVITPEIRENTEKGGIGISIVDTGIVRYPFFIAIWEGLKTTVLITWAIMVAFYELLSKLILGQGMSGQIAGPIGIAALTGQVARLGFVYILQFTAILSINLAIINAFPFPALDGGRLLFLFIEKIKGGPVKKEVEAVIHNIGFALLMFLILIVTFNDVAKYGDWFRGVWEKIAG